MGEVYKLSDGQEAFILGPGEVEWKARIALKSELEQDPEYMEISEADTTEFLAVHLDAADLMHNNPKSRFDFITRFIYGIK